MVSTKDIRKVDQTETPEELISEAASDIFARFGMRKVLGKVWSTLYLSPEPMDADQLREALDVSTGNLSMALNELMELGLIRRDTMPSQRKFFYSAETEMWNLITTIFRERERPRFMASIEKLSRAEAMLEERDGDSFAVEQVRHLTELGNFVVDILDAFMDRTRVEMKAAQKWFSVSGKLGGEPLSRLRKRINAARTEKKR